MSHREREILRDLCYRTTKKDISSINRRAAEIALLYVLKKLNDRR